jgi:uncharacterized protein (UPF0276 family)
VYNFVTPAKLGVGFTYEPGLQVAVADWRDLIDFFEISPDALCTERVRGNQRVLEYQQATLDETLAHVADRPVVVHGLGLSIGSVSGWNEGYLEILDIFQRLRPFPWHSEHLGFMLTKDRAGRAMHTGVPLPLPFSREAVDLIAPRAEAMCRRYGVPFLLENLTYYLPGLPAEGERDEVAFLNDLTERSGCGLLLDLYNFHCNAVNLGFDPREALSRLRLDRVIEVHLAGGATHDGFVLDVHSDVVPEPVWELFEWTVPRLPNLAGVVYELLEQALPIVGVDGIRRQLERVHEISSQSCWNERKGVADAARW